MSHLGHPIVVHESNVYCDRCQAEYAVVTDGREAFGNGEREMTFSRDASRPGVIVADCTYRNARTGEGCDGHIAVDLTTPGWTAEPEYVDLLATFGTVVES